MPKTIYKYTIPVEDSPKIEMPVGAKVLHVNVQRGVPCIWVEVDPSNEIETREFQVYGTGHMIPDNSGTYLGTFMVDDGNYVFHIYE